MSRIEQDVQQIAEYGSEIANSIIHTAIFFSVNLATMLSLNWQMTLSILPLLPLLFWVRASFGTRIRNSANQAQTHVGKASGTLAEHLGAVPQLQILGAEDIQTSRTIGALVNMLGAQWSLRRAEIAFISITSVLACGILIVLGLGVHNYFLKLLSLGGLVAFYTYVTRIFEPISNAMELYSRTQRISASIRRIREVLDTAPSVPDKGHIRPPPELICGLSYENVSFCYQSGEHILKDISFRIRAAERVGIVGRSGSGKSTVVRLMARMSDPTSGLISLENQPIRDYPLHLLRRTICYVPQRPVLFSGTLRENLLYSNPSASDKEIGSAIEIAQLSPLLARLPLGMNTILGAEAAGLSGGELQRLAIARGLLRRSPTVILDEATSALDLPTKEAIFRAIAAHRPYQILIVISHRLRSLTWVERLILLDAGTISEEGSHATLYRESALYRSLYITQDETEGLISPEINEQARTGR